MKKLLLAALLASASTVAAHAGTTPCQGKIVFDTVYQTGVSGGKYDYYFQIRNATNSAITTDAMIGGFPSGVSLFSPSLPNITLRANENKRIKFGSGTNSQINDGMVRKFYDSRGTSGAWVAAMNCKM